MVKEKGTYEAFEQYGDTIITFNKGTERESTLIFKQTQMMIAKTNAKKQGYK